VAGVGADIATDQTNRSTLTTLTFLRERSLEATTEEEKHRDNQIHH
jgi:hypothetical protein